jgi:hypothetical protein
LDISNFTLKELFEYRKIAALKRHISVSDDGSHVYVLINYMLFIIDNDNYRIKHIDGKNFNQVLGDNVGRAYILTNNGEVINLSSNYPGAGYFKINIRNKIANISGYFKDDILLTTIDGESYKNASFAVFCPIKDLDGIIQKEELLFLTKDGKVYLKTRNNNYGSYDSPYFDISKILISNDEFIHVIGLPNIKQITEKGVVLAENGLLYAINPKDLSVKLIPGFEDIVQVITTKSPENPTYMVALDKNGKISSRRMDFLFDKYKSVYYGRDVIEISSSCNHLIVLNNTMDLDFIDIEDDYKIVGDYDLQEVYNKAKI